jgi:hypothetical protein
VAAISTSTGTIILIGTPILPPGIEPTSLERGLAAGSIIRSIAEAHPTETGAQLINMAAGLANNLPAQRVTARALELEVWQEVIV